MGSRGALVFLSRAGLELDDVRRLLPLGTVNDFELVFLTFGQLHGTDGDILQAVDSAFLFQPLHIV